MSPPSADAIDVALAGSRAPPSAAPPPCARYLIARAAADMVAERIRRGGQDAVDALADEVLAAGSCRHTRQELVNGEHVF